MRHCVNTRGHVKIQVICSLSHRSQDNSLSIWLYFATHFAVLMYNMGRLVTENILFWPTKFKRMLSLCFIPTLVYTKNDKFKLLSCFVSMQIMQIIVNGCSLAQEVKSVQKSRVLEGSFIFDYQFCRNYPRRRLHVCVVKLPRISAILKHMIVIRILFSE